VPLLLGNPHLRWAERYWEAHVRVPGRLDFYGSTLAGIPVLRAGFNADVAYVQTNKPQTRTSTPTLQARSSRPLASPVAAAHRPAEGDDRGNSQTL
jgi:acyl-homoserine-lactone acylase